MCRCSVFQSRIIVGIFHLDVTLTVAMTFKSIIALLMGLVIQLSQVPSCLAAEPANPCAKSSQRMTCCEGSKSCPCAKESDQKQKPAPLVPSQVDLKLLISKAPESTRLAASISPPADAVLVAASALENRSAYAGVPLSVAFCRFVI